jgi:hypothetical protein
MKTTSKAIVTALIGAALLAGITSAVEVSSHASAATAIEYGLLMRPGATAIEY